MSKRKRTPERQLELDCLRLRHAAVAVVNHEAGSEKLVTDVVEQALRLQTMLRETT